MSNKVRMIDLEIGEQYKLPDDFDTNYMRNFGLYNITTALKTKPHTLIHKTIRPPWLTLPLSVSIDFQPNAEDRAAGIHYLQVSSILMPNNVNQIFLKEKSLSNVYKNKGTEFGVRNTFERMGVTGYNPAANTIVKQATGVRYTPNPYMPRKSRKTRNHRKARRTKTINKRR